jgi:hypothetical protein
MLSEQISQIVSLLHRSKRLSSYVCVMTIVAYISLSGQANLSETFAQPRATDRTVSDGKGNLIDSDYRIGDIRAYLWHESLGRLSTDDALRLLPGGLWNTPYGPGETPSSRATLVVVEVTGPPDGLAPRRMLMFAATARLLDGRTTVLLRKSVPIARLSVRGKYFVPFLLHDTGCIRIELHAEIRGQRNSVGIDKVLDFRCGE